MYYRRKILLSLLEVFGNDLEKIRLQKLLLLFTQKQETAAYDFVPYKFGCFSFHANADLLKTKEILNQCFATLAGIPKARMLCQVAYEFSSIAAPNLVTRGFIPGTSWQAGSRSAVRYGLVICV